jgi:hypothetical protein
MTELSNPLKPADCNLRDFQFMPLDVKRLLTSETWILGTGEEKAAAIALWLESWHQFPAGSLPDNDRMLAHLSQSKSWARVKAHALRGWVKCSDGRLYHAVVSEKVLEAWVEKLLNSLSGSAGNAKRWGIEVDTDTISSRVVEAASLLRAIAPNRKRCAKSRSFQSCRHRPPDPKKVAPRPENGSPPESPPDTPGESPPESPGDRKGQRQGYVNPSSGSGIDTASDRASEGESPPAAVAFVDVLQTHGVSADAADERLPQWVDAGAAVTDIVAAIAEAKARRSKAQPAARWAA